MKMSPSVNFSSRAGSFLVQAWLSCGVQFVFEQLAFIEIGVFPVKGDQFFVFATFYDAAVLQDAYQIGVADRRNPM